MRMVTLTLVIVMAAITLSACTSTEAEQENPFSGRFAELYAGNYKKVIVDKETGVCYLWRKHGYGGGLTVLLDADGTPLTYEEAWYQTYQEGDHAE